MTRYFNSLETAKKELDNQVNRFNFPRMESRIVYGDKFHVCAHVDECECGNCPTLQTDGTIRTKQNTASI
jgi:hypothetical protein